MQFWICTPTQDSAKSLPFSLAAKGVGDTDYSDSAMIAFFLPIDTVPKLEAVWPAGIFPEHLLVNLRAFADTVGQPALTGVVNGWGRFNGEEADAVYLNFDAPALPRFRQALIDSLSTLLSMKADHGYTPHITIGYVPKGEPVVMVEMPAMIKIAFDTMTLAWGGVYYPVRLGPQTSDSTL